VIKTLKYLVLGEFIPYGKLLEWVKEAFGRDPQTQEEFNAIDETGARSMNILENMESMLVVALVLLVIFLGIAVFSLFKRYNDSVFQVYTQTKNRIFWNVLIRTSLQSYLKMAFTTVTSLQLMRWSHFGQVVTSLLAIISGIILVVLPVLYLLVLRRNREQLFMPSVSSRIGALYLGLREKQTSAQAFAIVYLIRRIFFVFLTFTLASTPHLTVQFFMYSILFYMIYLGFSKPHTHLLQWRVGLVNEFLLLTQFYYFLLYSGLVLEPVIVYRVVGWAHVTHLGVLFLFNLLLIMVLTFKDLRWKWHLYKLAKQ